MKQRLLTVLLLSLVLLLCACSSKPSEDGPPPTGGGTTGAPASDDGSRDQPETPGTSGQENSGGSAPASEKIRDEKIVSRTKVDLNTAWDYRQGESGDLLSSGTVTGWTAVNLPHNTSLYTAEDKNAYLGISCYRKQFSLPKELQGSHVVLTFEGVMQNCEVYLNGTRIAEHHDGYTPFEIDVSDLLRFGTDNLLSVRTDSSPDPDYTPGKSEPDFQYFGGIYRNVFLTVTSSAYIGSAISDQVTAGGGIFLTSPSVSAAQADVHARTYVHNEGPASDFLLRTELWYDGGIVTSSEQTHAIEQGGAVSYDSLLTVAQPHLWHPYTPELYTVRSTLLKDGQIIDTVETTYGIRSVQWAHDGLRINGELFQAQGANFHSDLFVIGNAIPDNEVYEEVRRLKENGFDFIRMSHYPHSNAYYDACDRYGVLVLDCMSGWQNFNHSQSFLQSTYDELRTMIRNSRNHPCIIAWETSLNESNYTEEWAATVNLIAHEEYPADGQSRMWTAGWLTDRFDLTLGASQHGIRDSADYSAKGVIISEYGDWDYGGTTSTSRSAREAGDAAMLTQAGNHIESAILTRSKAWYAADALWAYMDYAGFDSGMTYCGVADMYRINKYSAFFYRSQRDPDVDLGAYGIESGAMVFIANSLSASSPSDVTVFSNCDKVELFVDGVRFAVQTPDTEYYGNNSGGLLSTESLPHPPFTFRNANHGASELKAVGYRNGAAVSECLVRAPGAATQVRLRAETDAPLTANGSDLRLVWVSLTDQNGTVTVAEDAYVTFTVDGGYVVGYEGVYTKGGQIGVWVRADQSTVDGMLTLSAFSDGLQSASLTVATVGSDAAPSAARNEYAGWTQENARPEHDAHGSQNLALGKAAYASTENHGVEVAGLAVDGDENSWWCADNTQPGPHWWAIDLGERTAVETAILRFEERTHTTYTFVLQGSDDGERWTTIADYSRADGPNGVCEIKVSGTYRYFRVDAIRADSDMWPTVAEFELYAPAASSSLSDKAREQPAYASSCADGCSAEAANNGDPGSFWYPAKEDNAVWWYTDMGAVYQVGRIEISWNRFEEHRYLIEASEDAETWIPVIDRSVSGEEGSQSVEHADVSARYIRISFPAHTGYGINMFYVYAQ